MPASSEAGPSTRPSTPPPSTRSRPGPPETPEHVRVMQENRLKAKARIQAQAAAQYPQHTFNSNSKRPLGPLPLEGAPAPRGRAAANAAAGVPSTSRNAADGAQSSITSRPKINPRTGRPMAPDANASASSSNAPLPRDQALGDYIEFDLSRLHNSKGGFLVDEDDPHGTGAAAQKTVQEVRLERERERARIRAAMEPGVNLSDADMVCAECGSRELHDELRRTFGVKVCRKCERKLPEKYSLLTKTEVKEDYLLTDSELRDGELLPHLLKANPHKRTYSNMMLFLRCQVEAYAFGPQKWGSERGLDEEFERRSDVKSAKRGKKFLQGLSELRKRTRDNVWQQRRDEEHRHEYEDVEEEDGEGEEGVQTQVCKGCGHVIQVEVF